MRGVLDDVSEGWEVRVVTMDWRSVMWLDIATITLSEVFCEIWSMDLVSKRKETKWMASVAPLGTLSPEKYGGELPIVVEGMVGLHTEQRLWR